MATCNQQCFRGVSLIYYQKRPGFWDLPISQWHLAELVEDWMTHWAPPISAVLKLSREWPGTMSDYQECHPTVRPFFLINNKLIKALSHYFVSFQITFPSPDTIPWFFAGYVFIFDSFMVSLYIISYFVCAIGHSGAIKTWYLQII